MNWDDRLTKAITHFVVVLFGVSIVWNGPEVGLPMWTAVLIGIVIALHLIWCITDIEILINTKE